MYLTENNTDETDRKILTALCSISCNVMFNKYALENINLGFTMGMQGGYTIVLDTTKYRYLRVYATLDGYEAQTFVSIVDTEKLEFYLKANNPASMYFYSMRFSLTTNHNFFSSGQYCKYEFSTSTGTFKRTLAARSADYYIYKIEGYF